MKSEKINVYGMTCEHCVKTVTKAVSSLKGVISVDVNLKGEYADVTYNEKSLGTDDIKKAVRESGYDTERGGHGGMKGAVEENDAASAVEQQKQYKFSISAPELSLIL